MPIKYFVSKVGVFMDDVCCRDVDVLFLGDLGFLRINGPILKIRVQVRTCKGMILEVQYIYTILHKYFKIKKRHRQR